MVSLPTVLARVKSDLTVLSLHESGQLTDAVLASRLCELDLGCMVLENAGDHFLLEPGAGGCPAQRSGVCDAVEVHVAVFDARAVVA